MAEGVGDTLQVISNVEMALEDDDSKQPGYTSQTTILYKQEPQFARTHMTTLLAYSIIGHTHLFCKFSLSC